MNYAFILFPRCTLGMWRKAGYVGGSTENMVKRYLAFLSVSWSVLVVQWSWGSWKGMPHQIYLVQILLSHSQVCCTVLSASYVKVIINNCGSKAKLFRNVRQLQNQVFMDLRLSKDEWFPDISKNTLAARTACSFKTTLRYIRLEHWKPLTQYTIIPKDLNLQHCCKNLKTDICRLLTL